MNRTELVSAIAERSNISRKDSEKVIKAFVDVVTEQLRCGDKISMTGFGTFEAARREERKGRNPMTGDEMVIPAATVPRFKAGKALKDEVNVR